MTPQSVLVDQCQVDITVDGVVQGVGYRPFVYRLATGLGLRGEVRNAGGSVAIRVAGGRDAIAEFVAKLRDEAPSAAAVERVHTAPAELAAAQGFTIRPSVAESARAPRVSPDLATCASCLEELFDPADRRYRYPFINCTLCGPRATVIDELPYDRVRTAMRGFPMCPACAGEYHDPGDRRFHAEPTCCPACGPRLSWQQRGRTDGPTAESALDAACTTIAEGGIVAVKGVGGYHLVCDATTDDAVARLRLAKARPAKPLAVMVADVTTARTVGVVDGLAEALLTSAAAPILLVPRRAEAPVSDGVAPGLGEIGLFLPYSPLHHLLLAQLRRPLVVTSGNLCGATTITDDDTARAVLAPIADGLLTHDRPIWSGYDDSVLRVVRGRSMTVRRARGYAPRALPLPVPTVTPVLAVGAQLKHTCTLAAGAAAILGPHLGDLENADTYAGFERTVATLSRQHDISPDIVAHDHHPGYLSTRYARQRWPAAKRISVQHHHAHVAATAAEHGVTCSFVGVALDGLGFGDDGTFWGGEILLADYTGYRRFGRFGTAPMPGGSAAVRRPARMALGYLFGAEPFGGNGIDPGLTAPLRARMTDREVAVVRAMVTSELNSPRASSAGRLFDAVAALLGVCDDNTYEGEAAVRLEAAATGHPGRDPLPWRLYRRGGLLVYDPMPTITAALQLVGAEPVGEIAARFLRTVADVVVGMAVDAARHAHVEVACLGGGVFQNARLTGLVLDGLAGAGLIGHVGQQVPVNDGGISYGQAVIAAARVNGG